MRTNSIPPSRAELLADEPPAVLPETAEYRERIVPEHQRTQYALTTTLRRFWLDVQPGGKWETIGRQRAPRNPEKKVKRTEDGRNPDTVGKERQALNRFERYSQPADWNPEKPWVGPSLAWLSDHGKFIDEVLQAMGQEMADATVASTRGHLMTIFNHAARVCAIPRAPQVQTIELEDGVCRILTPEEVDRLLRALASQPRLLAAAIVALHCGPRAEDLFCLRWEDIRADVRGRRVIEFTAQKTKKLQGVPLLERVWWFLDRLPKESPYVFPGLTSPESIDPERSRAARGRNQIMKLICGEVGLSDLHKPWQVLRRTCNERLETVAPGVGQFVLGHGLAGVNAKNYRQPTEAVWAGMDKVPLDAFVAEMVPCHKSQRLLF